MENPDPVKEGCEETFPWDLGVFDAHCHPTDTIASQHNIPKMKARALTIMATRGEDQDLVRQFTNRYGVEKGILELGGSQADLDSSERLVPAFGWHPWFSHQIHDDLSSTHSDPQRPNARQHYQSVLSPSPDDDEFLASLPEPRPLSDLLDQIRNNLTTFPSALVGEIGIDRSFRLPMQWAHDREEKRDEGLTPGGREGRQLSPYRVRIDHQRKILKAQLNLAGELQRPVSVHGVAAHGILFETLKKTWKGYERRVISKSKSRRKSNAAGAHENEATFDPGAGHGTSKATTGSKPYPPRICLHSYSGPLDTLKQYLDPSIPASIYFSFSRLVNFSNRTEKAVAVIKDVPNDKILVESDLHSAGDSMDQLLEDIVRSVCEIKGWSLTEGVKQLASNWKRFISGAGEESMNQLSALDSGR
ncbi:MAG: hypothetical protein L6R40_003625 [Gallowayella cf. fulva]|nr:MAG: hypothetical protein L6R40_003625 [Xanthomendoza cf. fulva]